MPRPARKQKTVDQEPMTLHGVLVAWQEGKLPYRQAMARAGIDTLAGLYAAAASSGVPIRKTLLQWEKIASELATAAIRRRLLETDTDEGG